MADTATSRYKARKQSSGSNTNTWGDTKLNDNFDLLDHGSKGVDSITMTGDYTLSWANYDTSSEANVGQCSVLLLTGSLSSAANLTVPAVEWHWDLIKNSTGQTVTVKTSAGTGVSIPTGRQVSVYCDASECYYAGPNIVGTDISEANSRDLADKSYVDTAVATLSGITTVGTVLISGSDTTSSYLNDAISVSGSLSKAITNAGANETLTISFTFDEGQAALFAEAMS